MGDEDEDEDEGITWCNVCLCDLISGLAWEGI